MRVYPARSRNEWEFAGSWKDKEKALDHARTLRADKKTNVRIKQQRGVYVVYYQLREH